MHSESDYKFWRNQTTKVIKRSKAIFYKNSIHHYQSNPKMLSNIFAELSGKTSGHTAPTCLNFKSQAITGDKNIAEAFNNHFTQMLEPI